MKKTKDTIFGGALALQSTELLKDRSISSLTNTATGFLGIGIAGAVANQSYKLVKFKSKTKAEQYRKNFVKKYGYKPKMFIHKRGKRTLGYKFVKPSGLKKI